MYVSYNALPLCNQSLAADYLHIHIQKQHKGTAFTASATTSAQQNSGTTSTSSSSASASTSVCVQNIETPSCGHDSVEDASTAMRLILLKMEQGTPTPTHSPLLPRPLPCSLSLPLSHSIAAFCIVQCLFGTPLHDAKFSYCYCLIARDCLRS